MSIPLAFAMKVDVTCDPALEVGEVYEGFRRVIPITGGSFEGPNLRGEVLSGGADWNLSRPDGTGEVWARYTLKTEDDVLISIINQGKSYHKQAIGSEENDAPYFYTTPSFEVAHEKYKWLQENMFIGKIQPTNYGVELTFYRLV